MHPGDVLLKDSIEQMEFPVIACPRTSMFRNVALT